MWRQAKCYFCGELGDVAPETEPGDYLACQACSSVGVWDGAGNANEMTAPERAEFLSEYPATWLN